MLYEPIPDYGIGSLLLGDLAARESPIIIAKLGITFTLK